MNQTNSRQTDAVKQFHKLHESGCFVLPNPWDKGSAVFLEHLGFKALATTSVGFAFSRALPDSSAVVPRELVLDHFADIASSVSVPVNADFQNGYADSPEGVAESVKLCVATGVAGLSVEDSSTAANTPLYDFDLAVERIKAARAAIDASGMPAVLTARCEAWVVGHEEPFQTALERLSAFADAGADCLYAPGVSKVEEIEAIVKAVAPKPVNVLVARFNSDLTLSQLRDLGVRRISVGSALAAIAWNAFISAAKEIAESGSFTQLNQTGGYSELKALFK
jgi:2-methylisocitrate lyase-like PEP mutase family enzyme